MAAEEPETLEGTRRSKRPRAHVSEDNNPLVASITPLQCLMANGGTRPLHHCDIVFMTYESLRKELGYQQKCAHIPSARTLLGDFNLSRHHWPETALGLLSQCLLAAGEARGLNTYELEAVALEPFLI